MKFLRRPQRSDSNPAPDDAHRARELAIIQCVSSFFSCDAPLPHLSLPQDHPPEGLSGRRAWRMLSAHTAIFNQTGSGANLIDEVCISLREEIARLPANSRRGSHLQKLLGFATGLWALRSAAALSPDTGAANANDRCAVIAAAAEEAASMVRSEPYLRLLQSQTLLLLNRPDEAATALAPLNGAPWIGAAAQESVVQMLEICKDPSYRLPRRSPPERLRAMSSLPGWLDLAGAKLPDLLLAEAASRDPLGPFVPTLHLDISQADLGADDASNAIIGGPPGDPTQSTIVGLRTALQRRFEVELPGVRLRIDPGLDRGRAKALIDGRVVAEADEVTAVEITSAASWWPGASQAVNALQTLLLASLRHLELFRPTALTTSRQEEEARNAMLADRLPYSTLRHALQPWLSRNADAVSAVSALRLATLTDATANTVLWGNEAARTPVLLDRDLEEEIQQHTITHLGLAVPADIVTNVISRLRNIFTHEAATDSPRVWSLVVREPILRPLIRALLRPMFPDLPVLALAEIKIKSDMLTMAQATP